MVWWTHRYFVFVGGDGGGTWLNESSLLAVAVGLSVGISSE